MAAEPNPFPQMNIKVDRVKRAKMVATARALGEKDDIGDGASAVIRRAIDAYLDEHEAELPEWWRNHL